MPETVAGRALWTVVLVLSVCLDHAAWMIFSDKDMCVRLQTEGELTIGRSNRSFPIPDPDDDPHRLVVKMRSLEFQTKGGVTLSRVNWEEKKSGAFHLDPWEADELEGIRAQGRRMWDNVGTRVTVRVYLFARSGVITSLGDIRVDKGDVKIEFEFEELQCVDCEQFLQIKAVVTGRSSRALVIRNKKTFGKILQFGGGASVWLPNKRFTGDDAKTEVDVETERETATDGATSAVITVRLPLVPARPALYSLLVKPARPTPPGASDTGGGGTDSDSHTHQSPGGAQLSHSAGRFAVVLCLCAAVVFLW